MGPLQSADPGHAAQSAMCSYKPHALGKRKSKALTNACAACHPESSESADIERVLGADFNAKLGACEAWQGAPLLTVGTVTWSACEIGIKKPAMTQMVARLRSAAEIPFLFRGRRSATIEKSTSINYK